MESSVVYGTDRYGAGYRVLFFTKNLTVLSADPPIVFDTRGNGVFSRKTHVRGSDPSLFFDYELAFALCGNRLTLRWISGEFRHPRLLPPVMGVRAVQLRDCGDTRCDGPRLWIYRFDERFCENFGRDPEQVFDEPVGDAFDYTGTLLCGKDFVWDGFPDDRVAPICFAPERYRHRYRLTLEHGTVVAAETQADA